MWHAILTSVAGLEIRLHQGHRARPVLEALTLADKSSPSLHHPRKKVQPWAETFPGPLLCSPYSHQSDHQQKCCHLGQDRILGWGCGVGRGRRPRCWPVPWWRHVFSRVWLFRAPWTIACQVPLSMQFPEQEYRSGLPFPPPRDFPRSGI